MPKWEVCHIELRLAQKDLRTWVAIQDTLEGEKVIDQTQNFAWSNEDKWRQIWEPEHSKLVARLLANGWEPFSIDSRNDFSHFRRQVP